MKFGNIKLIILGLVFTSNLQAIRIKEKGIDFEELGSRLGNLTFVALNKSKTHQKQLEPENNEMVQLHKSGSGDLDNDEMEELLDDTFGKKEKETKVAEDEENSEDKQEESVAEEVKEPALENEMTLTEQLEAAKAQADKDQKDAEKKEKQTKQAELAKKKKIALEIKTKKEKAEKEQKLIDLAGEQAVAEAIEEHENGQDTSELNKYSEDIRLAEKTMAEQEEREKDLKDGKMTEEVASEAEEKPDLQVKKFKNADEAMASASKGVAEKEYDLKQNEGKKQKQSQNKKMAKKKIAKKTAPKDNEAVQTTSDEKKAAKKPKNQKVTKKITKPKKKLTKPKPKNLAQKSKKAEKTVEQKIEEARKEQEDNEPPKSKLQQKLDELTMAKVDEQFHKELAQNGEKAPSDITEALADSTSTGDDAEEPSGFFGKYIKKHKDAKMKAQKQVLDEQREAKERKENEEAAEKESRRQEAAAASVEYPSMSATPKKKHHLGFAERAQQKMIENEERDNEKGDQMLIQENSEQVLEHLWPEAANV